jgi:hypothetical protein
MCILKIKHHRPYEYVVKHFQFVFLTRNAYAQREWESGVAAARMACVCASIFYSSKEDMIWKYVVVCRKAGPRMQSSGSMLCVQWFLQCIPSIFPQQSYGVQDL